MPLWTGAAALYHIAFATHAADVRVRALSCDLKSVSLAVTNLGDRAAIVGGYSLVVSDSGQVTPPYSLLAKKPMTVVRPEKTIVLSLEPRMTGTSTGISVPPVATDCKFEISVEVNAFEGGASQQKVTCDCPPAA